MKKYIQILIAAQLFWFSMNVSAAGFIFPFTLTHKQGVQAVQETAQDLLKFKSYQDSAKSIFANKNAPYSYQDFQSITKSLNLDIPVKLKQTGKAIVLDLDGVQTTLELVNFEKQLYKLNGYEFVFDASKSIKDQVNYLDRILNMKRQASLMNIFLPEAHAQVGALAVLIAVLLSGLFVKGIFMYQEHKQEELFKDLSRTLREYDSKNITISPTCTKPKIVTLSDREDFNKTIELEDLKSVPSSERTIAEAIKKLCENGIVRAKFEEIIKKYNDTISNRSRQSEGSATATGTDG